jgi:DUF4097 and DUF4098 domain-containing protein YvlB
MSMKRTGLAILLALAAALAAGAAGAREPDFTIPGISSIQVKAGALDVSVIGEDTDTVTMRAELPQDSFFDHRDYDIVHEVKGSQLRIRIETQRVFAVADQGRITLIVPRDTSLRIESTSGTVSLQGLERTAASASTNSGEIRVRDAKGEIVVSTVSGRISLEGTDGRVDAHTVSGRIRGERVRLSSDSTFNTVSGDITIGLDTPIDNLRFDLATISGAVRVGKLRTHRGLHMGFGDVSVTGSSVSGSIRFQ